MTSKPNSYNQKLLKSQDKQSANVQKSILRNAEVPIINNPDNNNRYTKFPVDQRNSSSQRYRHQKFEHQMFDHHDSRNDQIRSNQQFHEPRLNKIEEMKKTLDDLKLYEANTLESFQDLSKNSRELVNREVNATTKLIYFL